MNMDLFTDHQLRDWLLHRLDAPRAAALEERLLADDALLERALDLRNDLFDDYARGTLDEELRRQFVTHCLSGPDARQRLAFAAALAQLRASPRPRARIWRNGGAIAAGMLLLTGALWFGWREKQTPLPTLALAASVQRSGGALDIDLPAASRLRLQAEIENAADDARYTLRVTDDATNLFEAQHLQVRHAGAYAFVEIDAPTAVLGPGQRRVLLQAEGAAPRTLATWSIRTHAAH